MHDRPDLPAYPEDPWLERFVGVAALRAAIELGLIDRLASAPREARTLAAEGPAMAQLLDILEAERVIVRPAGDGLAALAPAFAAVHAARGRALQARLEFLVRAARDLLADPAAVFADLPRHMARSETFSLYRYDLAATDDAAGREAARPWVEHVCALTEAEAPRLVPALPLPERGRLLEIGGNAGEMALAILAAHPGLSVAVLDLPAVCALGRARCAGRPGAERLGFLAGDARRDPWPAPADAVLFKSVLHDWPPEEAEALLARAAACAAPGAPVIVTERAPIRVPDPAPFHLAAELVFAPFFRPPEAYVAMMTRVGLSPEPPRRAHPSLPFHVVTGRAG
ncbi:methyltransferase [uncultured Albimonas sp.]|uniref:methyltransferase n=1 Tax=uncultured Albimonas sp. TaxID=1331701 RepID=UPI0030EB805E|tara:strand:+ start:4079 stop:5101 length:1023 start_codon:yes stop_codon:yes gene_type:complete